MKKKKVLKSTDNSTVYRHTLRNYLYNYGSCDRCSPHGGCNRRNRYGGFAHEKLKYPSWKQVSKNPKQWMGKPIKRVEKRLYWRTKPRSIDERGESVVPLDQIYVTIKW